MRRVIVDQPHVVRPSSFSSTIRSGTTYWVPLSAAKDAPGLGLSREVLECFLDRLDWKPGLLLDRRQPVVLEIVQMMANQSPEHVVTSVSASVAKADTHANRERRRPEDPVSGPAGGFLGLLLRGLVPESRITSCRLNLR